MPLDGETTSTTLEVVADAAERVAQEQLAVAEAVREIGEQRKAGRSWSRIMERHDAAEVLTRLRRSRRLVGDATTRVGRLVAEGMAREGASHRAIADRLGLSHQRVTSLLNLHPDASRRSPMEGQVPLPDALH